MNPRHSLRGRDYVLPVIVLLTIVPAIWAQSIPAKLADAEFVGRHLAEDSQVSTKVLPKASARNLLDVEPADLAHVMQAAQKIAKAAVKVFSADGITIQQFNESAGGQVVFHLHVHVIPRKEGVPMKPPASVKEEMSVLSDQALKLSAALRG